MAIQFPPINVGDDPPANGDTYTYVPTQTEYVYNQIENSWSIVTDSGDVTPVIGKLQAGTGVTLVPADGDLAAGNVTINSTGSGDAGYWKRNNGILSPTTDGDDVAVADVAGGAFRIDSMQNIDSL